jgi:hypothetical protein
MRKPLPKNLLIANEKCGILIKVEGGSTEATPFSGQHPYLPNPSADHKAILFTTASPGQTGDDFISMGLPRDDIEGAEAG